ncbi:MAG: PAS domain S-box protein [Spirochaetaceae bacterium]|nr:MAG: PAS domain S-box protein [Spirochaetaceae bacterium]
MREFWSFHILLVEDEILIGQSERLMLEDAGYRCTLVGSGEKALAFVEQDPDVDLILMDLHLGEGMSGIETARRLHETHEIPIVFLSSQTDPDRIAETETVNSHGFIVKGSTEAVMLAQIRTAFRLSQAREGERISEKARRESEARYRELFESSQVSLWLEDYSAMKDAVDRLRAQGVYDIDAYYREHDDELWSLALLPKVLRANEATLRLYGAASETQFRGEFHKIFPEACFKNFRATVVAIAAGETHFEVTEQHRRFDGQLLDVRVRWTVLPGDDGTYSSIAMSVVDLTEITRALSDLEHEKQHFEKLFQNAPVAIAVVDQAGCIQRINPGYTDLFGYEPSEAVGRNALDLIVPEGYQAVSSSLFERVQNGPPVAEEHVRQHKDGTLVEVLITGAVMYVNGQQYAFGIYQDIGPRKEAEALAKQLLQEKTILLRETHHRIKNNMAVIEGLLRLHAEGSDPAAADVLNDAASRLHGMSMLYDLLYRNEQSGKLSLRDFLTPLARETTKLVAASVPVSLDIDLDDIELDAAILSPIGIIVNELIANSAKYAFDGRDRGRISLRTGRKDGLIMLQYDDDGVGFSDEAVSAASSGFGLELVKMLAEQIGAELCIDGESGMKATIALPFSLS